MMEILALIFLMIACFTAVQVLKDQHTFTEYQAGTTLLSVIFIIYAVVRLFWILLYSGLGR